MAKSSKETMKTDEMKVLDVLEQHAKESISELGKRCGFSPQRVARIIKNLEKEKIIWGYSAIADGTLRGFKHFVLLVKRNTVPFDAAFKKELAFEKIDGILSSVAKIENMFFTHGCFDVVVIFYAPSLIEAKDFIEKIYKRVGKYFGEYRLLETLVPIRKSSLKNPKNKELVEYL